MKKSSVSEASLKTRRIVVCGILCTIGVVCMLIGAVTDVLDLTMMMIASLCIAFAVIEIGVRWAWLIWAATSVLCMLLLPSKSAALLYLMGGMYPTAKSAFERLHPLLCWILKFSMFNTLQLIFMLVATKILGLSGADYGFATGTLLFGNLLFLLYDFAMTAFISFYMIRLRKRIHFKPLK